MYHGQTVCSVMIIPGTISSSSEKISRRTALGVDGWLLSSMLSIMKGGGLRIGMTIINQIYTNVYACFNSQSDFIGYIDLKTEKSFSFYVEQIKNSYLISLYTQKPTLS